MDFEQVKQLVTEKQYCILQENRLGNDTGWQIRLKEGQIINVFDKGTVSVQGKNPEPIKLLLQGADEQAHPTASSALERNVFVVYGHDEDARNQLEILLRRWRFNPLILDQLPSEGQTIIEKLEKYRGKAEFAVVLATPDDEGYRAGSPDEKAFRVRQNVVLELGMMLAHLGRSRVAILLKEQEKMERPSDIQGLVYIPFKDDLKEASLPLAKEMNAQGFRIPLEKL